jgi:hypothetical protein
MALFAGHFRDGCPVGFSLAVYDYGDLSKMNWLVHWPESDGYPVRNVDSTSDAWRIGIRCGSMGLAEFRPSFGATLLVPPAVRLPWGCA